MKKILSVFLALMFTFALAACGGATTTENTESTQATTSSEIDYESEVTLNVALNYVSGGQLMSISYQKDAAYEALNGTTYTKGDLLPAWERIGEKLNVNFVDKATSSDANTNAQFTRLQTENFVGVDLVNATGALLGPEGVKGNFVDIGDYLEYMPNLKAFLDANPAVQVSMTAADGGIYFTPYFDGFGEIEQMFLARIDWIEDILDVTNPTFDTTAAVVPDNYTRRERRTLRPRTYDSPLKKSAYHIPLYGNDFRYKHYSVTIQNKEKLVKTISIFRTLSTIERFYFLLTTRTLFDVSVRISRPLAPHYKTASKRYVSRRFYLREKMFSKYPPIEEESS